MKIFKSIKWRLQFWHGLVLLIVLAGYGFTAYQLERNRQFRRIDSDLQHRFAAVADLFRPPRRPEARFRPPVRPPSKRPPNRSPREHPSPHSPSRFIPATSLPAMMFQTNDPSGFFCVVCSPDNREIIRAGNVPALADHQRPPEETIAASSELFGTVLVPKPPQTRTFSDFREIIQVLPSGETIIVGCPLAPVWKELHATALKLTVFSVIVLFFGLAGGWWVAANAIRPVEQISSAAAKISTGDLSQRINVVETESELGRLAAVLNSTFARLDAAFTQQKQFASDAAHELRTPVSVILTQTQTALNRERGAAEYRETIEACQRAAQRMRKLIGQLLELARLDAGQEPMKRLRFDFSRTIADCVDLTRSLADECNVRIISEIPRLEISGDSERLAQVTTNLLTNAVQYNKPGGEVWLKLDSQGGLAVLTVTDMGQGIAGGDLPHIFERFYRGDKSRSGANAGLGLAISKAIVEAHSGTIEVSSQEDVGTTFTVRLPM